MARTSKLSRVPAPCARYPFRYKQVISRESAEADKVKQVVSKEEAAASAEAATVKAIKDDCEADLSKAMPLMEQAVQVGAWDFKGLQELRLEGA